MQNFQLIRTKSYGFWMKHLYSECANDEYTPRKIFTHEKIHRSNLFFPKLKNQKNHEILFLDETA